MKSFNYHQPTEIVFGSGRVGEIGTLARRFGRKVLLVTVQANEVLSPLFDRVKRCLADGGLEVVHFDGVAPNPTTDMVSAGAFLAKRSGVDLVVGLGGGSSMDAAKAIAVEATHEGSAWDYLHYKSQPTSRTLPVIAVSTTAGTGSQVTPCAVITRTEDRDKSAIWNANIFPRIAIVDPELTLSLPRNVTAQTGFDAFAHSFEAFLSTGANAYAEAIAFDGLRLAISGLPAAFDRGDDLEARSTMAWADTLGGLAISAAGVTLPHGLGMQVSGHCPQVSHGQSLAVFYPEFTRFTWASAVGKFARVARIFDPSLAAADDVEAAKVCCEEIDRFLRRIGLWIGFKDLGVGLADIGKVAEAGMVLPDYRNNPRVATIEEMREMLLRCYER